MNSLMNENELIIKRRGDDGSKVITIRIKDNLLSKLDTLSDESNISRNELINIILQYGVKNLKIEK